MGKHDEADVVIRGSALVLVEDLDQELGPGVTAIETGNVERDLGEIGVLVLEDRGGDVLLNPTRLVGLLARDTDVRVDGSDEVELGKIAERDGEEKDVLFRGETTGTGKVLRSGESVEREIMDVLR